ncbi:MAG TPA: hypothetical protein VGF59_25930 [Bryobacteraceae bacterium]|jgi:hypothetical protein
MFHYPATEVFSPAGDRRVAFSVEEFEQLLAAGFSEERPAAAPAPKAEEKKDEEKQPAEPKKPAAAKK